jgi:hypothetical protein
VGVPGCAIGGEPGGGGAGADVIGNIHECRGEALWLLRIDYEASVKSLVGMY